MTRDHSNIVVIFSFPRNIRFRNSHCVYETLKVYSRNAVAMHRRREKKKVSVISGEIDFFELSSFSETFLNRCVIVRETIILSLSYLHEFLGQIPPFDVSRKLAVLPLLIYTIYSNNILIFLYGKCTHEESLDVFHGRQHLGFLFGVKLSCHGPEE